MERRKREEEGVLPKRRKRKKVEEKGVLPRRREGSGITREEEEEKEI